MRDFASELRIQLAQGERGGTFSCSKAEYFDALKAIDSTGVRINWIDASKPDYRIRWFDARPPQAELALQS